MNDAVEIRGIDEVRRKLAALKSFLKNGDVNIYRQLGDKGIQIIKKRTLSGKDFRGRPFIPYNKEYAKRKRSSKVNLKLSGDMLKDISRQPFRQKVRIFIKKNRRRGKLTSYNIASIQNFPTMTGQKHRALNPERRFFEFSKKDRSVIKKYFKKLVSGKLKKIIK